MNPKEIRKVWYDIDAHLAKNSVAHPDLDINNTAASLLCPGPFYHFIFDFSNFTFVSVSESYEDLIGLKPEELNINKYLERIHPDDLEFFQMCEKVASQFLFEYLKPEEIPYYKVTYPIRFLTKDNTYKLFLRQSVGVSFDNTGRLCRVYAVDTDISHITTVNRKRMALIGINSRPSYTNIDVFQEGEIQFDQKISKLTVREIEILHLLSEGVTTKEIARRFSISELTVKKHRENLLKKVNAKNSTHLVAVAIREGLI